MLSQSTMAGGIMQSVDLLLTYLKKGGLPVMLCILVCGVVIWYIGLHRLFLMWRVEQARKRFLKALQETGTEQKGTGFDPYDTLLSNLSRAPHQQAVVNLSREFLVDTAAQLEDGFSTMATWIGVAPLLGLLGTVMGMMQTFRVITAFGVGNPNLMAEGISVALITTQAGLTVAFPAMLLLNFLTARRKGIMSKLIADKERLAQQLNLQSAPESVSHA